MTAADASHQKNAVDATAAKSTLAGLDRRLDRGSEWLNPILVKEARQSLKSRHFAVVFFLVLLGAWAWSFLGLTLGGQDMYYRAAGVTMLIGYVWIMLFPLVVAIPFMAFFSLAGERDDGTYELVAITTLHPRQLVAGRLATAALQMFVFQSVLAPCVTFTYMLRGVDLVMIVLLLLYSGGLCLLLTSAALFAATIGQSRLMNLLLAVPLLVGLVALYFGLCGSITDMLQFGVREDYATSQFWVAQGAVVSIGASFFLLLSVAATMMLTFPSQNRSTPLRLAMLVQQMLAVGWGTWYIVTEPLFPETLLVVIFLAVFYWGFMGSLMIGESPVLHQRARRKLPQSFLGRAFLTWLCPGPGTGYVFAVANFWTLAAVLLLAFAIRGDDPQNWWTASRRDFLVWTAILLPCYLTIYLGAARLIMVFFRRIASPAPPVGLLVTGLLVFVGTLGPITIETSMMAYDYSYNRYQYSLLQLPNPFMTFAELERNGSTSGFLVPILLCLLTLAGLVILVNLIFTGREVRRLREATPQRVLADDAARRPPPPKPAPVEF